MQIIDLRCEYRATPLGIDLPQPRLSWRLAATQRGTRQSAYRLLVATEPARLAHQLADLWDSGQVSTDQSLDIHYAGTRLQSGQRAWWCVQVWDAAGTMAMSAPAWWEMGLLERADWQAHWIGAALLGGPRTTAPCPFVRTAFVLAQPVASARLYISALGLYEAHLNGQTVGDDLLTPGWTDYRKRVAYQVYDVTTLVHPGENVLGAILGDGWYCGHIGANHRQFYGDRPRLLAQLCLTMRDGTTRCISSDHSWRTAFGPLLESDLLMGESYDARREFDGWDQPGFDAQDWRAVAVFADPAIALVAPRGPAVRRTEWREPVAEPRELKQWPASKWIFDLGQNMVGRVQLRVAGVAGTTLTLRYGEMLNPDGTLYTENLRTARATDHYTLRGDTNEVYEPRFTFHGFRYVELSGYPGQPTRATLTGVVLHSDIVPTGSFSCSEPLINQLQQNIDWGQRGNFLEVPTDCPQRDERVGWTGDSQVFIRTACFNRDVAAFFTKWQQDLADAQTELGQVPPIAPTIDPLSHSGGPAWSDALLICPWTIFLCYGDTHLLAEHYASLARFVAQLERTSIGLIRAHPDAPGGDGEWGGYGDWLALDGSGSFEGNTPKDLIGTAFFAYSASLMAQIAALLGHNDDAVRYRALCEAIGQAFRARFVTDAGLLVAQTQTAYVLALRFALLTPAQRPAAVAALVRDITRRGMHLSTGFVGTPYLLDVLADAGELDVAYALLLQTSYPSWLYPVIHGATTIWERWDGWTHDRGFNHPGMNSFNHYAYGAVGAWLYRMVGGIDLDPAHPGYKQSILRPRPGGGLTAAHATHDSRYGRIESEWSIVQQQFNWRVVVPPNTSATAYLPTSDPTTLAEGNQPLLPANGVAVLRHEPGVVVLALQPGEYCFSAQLVL